MLATGHLKLSFPSAVAFGILVSIFAPFSHSAASGSDVPSIAPVIDSLSRWRREFQTVRIRWQSGRRTEAESRSLEIIPVSFSESNEYNEYEFVWADFEAYSLEWKQFKSGKMVRRAFTGTDAPPLLSGEGLDALRPLWDSSGFWLDDRLRDADAARVLEAAWDEVQGIPCIRLTITRRHPRTKNVESVDTTWVDPEIGYLPRRSERCAISRKQEIRRLWTWTATEFAAMGGMLQWPVQGEFVAGEGSNTMTWMLQQVTLNESLTRAAFPTLPWASGDGRIVNNLTNELITIDEDQVASENDSLSDPVWSWAAPASVVLLIGAVVLRGIGKRL